jgi:beta-lactam-binding protein with PASTA domain
MKRLILFMPVLLVAIALFVFANNTEQGATIRADVRKRVGQAIDSAKAMAQDADDVAVDVATSDAATSEVETVSI